MRRTGALAVLAAFVLAGCGTSSQTAPGSRTTSYGAAARSGSGTSADQLPGAGRPQITIGDKNFTEQFVLGELYKQALEAQGYSVYLNRNIGPTEVTIPAIESGSLDLYPEYLSTWDRGVARIDHSFATRSEAYRAGVRYARVHGLRLLSPTPFSDTPAIAVTRRFAQAEGLRTLGDLRSLALDLGGPPQFQHALGALPALTRAYGFLPASYTALAIGGQYAALDRGTVQAAEVNTTDGQLSSGSYQVLADPQRVFGWGNVVPVVSQRAAVAEGPAFTQTIERVDALLSTGVMRRLNAGIDLRGLTAAAVAKSFLQAHGLVPSGAA